MLTPREMSRFHDAKDLIQPRIQPRATSQPVRHMKYSVAAVKDQLT